MAIRRLLLPQTGEGTYGEPRQAPSPTRQPYSHPDPAHEDTGGGRDLLSVHGLFGACTPMVGGRDQKTAGNGGFAESREERIDISTLRGMGRIVELAQDNAAPTPLKATTSRPVFRRSSRPAGPQPPPPPGRLADFGGSSLMTRTAGNRH